jgi:hypothetical protein
VIARGRISSCAHVRSYLCVDGVMAGIVVVLCGRREYFYNTCTSINIYCYVVLEYYIELLFTVLLLFRGNIFVH